MVAAAAKSLQSCPTLRPYRRQPRSLPHPWDSPGKNTGVGYHFLLQCRKVKSESEVAQSCPTLSDPMDCSLSGSSVHGIFQARVLEWVVIAFSKQSWSVQFSSVAQSCPTLCNPMNKARQASLSITNSWSSLKLMPIEWVMPSSHLILYRPLLLLLPIPPSIRVFSSESTLCMRWPKYWSFSFSISPSNEHPGTISFRWTGWISLQSNGLSRVFSNTTVQKHQFFGAQLSSQSNSHIHT